MDGFSVELREAREARGLSLDAMSEATKVSTRYLQALEAGRYGELPGGVFRRGILRSYLAVLGLDDGGWMDRFEQTCRNAGHTHDEEADWVAFAQNVKRNRLDTERSSSLRWLGVVALLLLLAAMGWCVWKFVLRPRLLSPLPSPPALVGSAPGSPRLPFSATAPSAIGPSATEAFAIRVDKSAGA